MGLVDAPCGVCVCVCMCERETARERERERARNAFEESGLRDEGSEFREFRA